MSAFRDLRGEKFGRLTPKIPQKRNGKYYWMCECECGNKTFVSASNLSSGQVKSCGCLQREMASKRMMGVNKTHGMFGTRLYRIWSGMITRCENPNHPYYERYGGRGIRICPEWREDNSRFFEWAKASGYSDGLTIDRIDNNGNYSPINCRWIPIGEQQRNKSDNHFVKIGGLDLSLVEWSELLNMNYSTVLTRIRYGWSDFDALTKPVMRNREENT